MATRRKFLLIGRHAQSPKNAAGDTIDTVVPGALREVYERVGLPTRESVKDYGLSPNRAFLIHSPATRTKYTGQAVLIGAFNLRPSEGANHPPEVSEDLEHYNGLKLIETKQEDQFAILKPGINKRIYSEAGSAAPNIDYLLQTPLATKHEESFIETRTSIEVRHLNGLRAALMKLTGEKDFGILAAHGAYTEVGFIIPLIETTGRKIATIEEIGGPIDTGEFTQLTIDLSRSGSPSARLEYKGQSHPVDLGKL